MFYIEKHQQWKELMDREMRGESIEAELEPGYKQAYEAWKMEMESDGKLQKLSAEERTEFFLKDLQENTLTQKKQVIEKMAVSEEEKKKLFALAQKDQLLLVSTDEGVHFDQVLTMEQVSKVDPLKVRILSQTLTSTTVDLEKVVEEQTLLHVVNNFKEAGYEIHDANLVDHVVKVEVSKLRKSTNDQDINEHITYDVPVNQDAFLPLEIYDTRKGKEAHFAETILAEEVGMLEPDSDFRFANNMEILDVETSFDSAQKEKQAILASFSAIAGAGMSQNASNSNMVNNAERLEAQEYEQRQFGNSRGSASTHVPMLDVMGAKQQFQAEKERETKDKEDQGKVQKSRDEKYEKDRKLALAKQAEQMEYQSKNQKKSKSMLRWGTALGATGAAGFTAGLAGLGVWVS